MYYIVIALLALILTVLLIKNAEKPQKGEFISLSEEEFTSGLKRRAKKMRILTRGRVLSPNVLLPSMRSAYRFIEQKVRRNQAITEGERWYYENFYHVRRTLDYAPFAALNDLPFSEGVPRIVSVARYLVLNSLETLDLERIEKGIEAINEEIVLTFEELTRLPTALEYALIEGVWILANRLLYYHKAERRAQGKGEILWDNDLFLHFYLKKHPNAESLYRMRGVEPESVKFHFSLSVVETARIAKYLFGTLGNIVDALSEERIMRMSRSDKIYRESASYLALAQDTRKAYLVHTGRLAARAEVSEAVVARIAKDYTQRYEIDLFETLYRQHKNLICALKRGGEPDAPRKKNETAKQTLYWGVLFALSVGGGVLAGILLQSIVCGILASAVGYFVWERALHALLASFVPSAILPRLDLSKIPYEHRTMIVVSVYATSLEQIEEMKKRVETLRAVQPDENVTAALLVDFRRAKAETIPEDAALLKALECMPEGCFAFVRKRLPIGEGKYGGKERKRGAILALCKYFRTGNSEEFRLFPANVTAPVYIIALDEDNLLAPGSVLSAVNVMAHPANAKYDLVAFHARYDAYSLKTPFARRYARESGYERYPNYTGLYFDLFGRAIFSGKGIFRVSSFYEKTEGVFPDGKILSHDILEGAVLRTASMGIVYEEAPQSYYAERMRAERWARGDLQQLPFVFRRWKNAEGKVYHSDIEPFYRLFFLRNAWKTLEPIFSLFLLTLAPIFSKALILFGILWLLPLMLDLLTCIRAQLMNGLRIGASASEIARIVLENVAKVFLLPYEGLSALSGTVRIAFRAIRKKDLLEWTTFHSVQGGGGVLSSIIHLFVWGGVALACATIGGFWAVWSVGMFVLFGIALYAWIGESGKEIIASDLKSSAREKLRAYAEKTFHYFRFMADKGEIIADNFQLKPYKGRAAVTSGTNLGFQLLAEIEGAELGFITEQDCIERLRALLGKIELLPKWRGNLYNWYRVKEGVNATPFVSSVDSGNFLAALYIIAGFARGKDAALAALAEAMIENTDLEALYDKEKGLFTLGFDVERGEYCAHYDLLASESRTLSLIFIAKGGELRHWNRLGRDLTPLKGNTLLSWSGTAFEYALPELFLASPADSLIGRSVRKACKIQSEEKIRGIWGKSESGYYAFDEHLNYQYRAFGSNRLRLSPEKERAVVSPYTTFLFLEFAQERGLANLERLKEKGVFGEYGFYEAIDLEGDQRIVESHMTHHQGMILTALTNALCKDAIRRYFLASPAIRAVRILLGESLPRMRVLPKNRIIPYKSNKKQDEYSLFIDNIEYSEAAFGATDGTLSVYQQADGSGFIKYGACLINRFHRGEANGERRGFFLLKDGNVLSPNCSLRENSSKEFTFSYTSNSASYRNTKFDLTWDVTISSNPALCVDVFRAPRDIGREVVFYEPLAMAEEEEFDAHPCYRAMFTEMELVKDGIVIFHRRTKEGAKFYVALVVKGLEGLVFRFDRFEAIGRKRAENEWKIFQSELSSEAPYRQPLEPCIALKGVLLGEKCEVYHLFSEDRDTLFSRIRALPKNVFSYAIQAGNRVKLSKLTQEMLYATLNEPYPDEALIEMKATGFFSLSEGRKIILYRAESDEVEPLVALAESISQLRYFGIRLNLFVLCGPGVNTAGEILFREALSEAHLNDFKIYRQGFQPMGLEKIAFRVLDYNLNFAQKKEKIIEIAEESFTNYKTEQTPKADFETGFGGFVGHDYRLDCSPALPYSNVVAMKGGGFVASENGGGFFFLDNAKERAVNRFSNDSVVDVPSECLFFTHGEETYRLNGGKACRSVFYRRGSIVYRTINGDFRAIAERFLVEDGAISVWEIHTNCEGEFSYCVELVLGNGWNTDFILVQKSAWGMLAWNLQNGFSVGFRLFDGCLSGRRNRVYAQGRGNLFYLIAGDPQKIESMSKEEIVRQKENSIWKFEHINPVRIEGIDEGTERIFNDWLLYQVLSSRLNGKTGYYQVGGATGFRDQLQDMLCFLYFDPERVRAQILYHAAHQYREGDVMHWWHHPNFGLRSRISDDKLYLPFLVAKYVEASGDFAILSERVPFVDSSPLAEWENNRFECAKSTQDESLHRHCLNAIRSALRFGEHNLLLLGGGDWNDGLDDAGTKGRAESVELTMFAAHVLEKYANLCEIELKNELIAISRRLKEVVDSVAYDGKQYMRLFGDDGVWYGTDGNPDFRIDLVVQSMSVIYEIGSEEHRSSALRQADRLFDREYGTVALLTPPLTPKTYLGYLSLYPEGVRENGGQYTHAAVWYLMALLKANEREKAYDLLLKLNPIYKCQTKEGAERYGGEPFVLSGDVYTGRYAGRMGWSWYTGSASWLYYVILTCLFGVKKKGNRIFCDPKLPECANGARLTANFSQTRLTIRFFAANEEKNGIYENGAFRPDGLELRPGEMEAEVYYES